MSNRLTGDYRARLQSTITYHYEVLWSVVTGKIFWDSTVTVDETEVSKPGGVIDYVPAGSDPDEMVRINIHDAIDALAVS